MCRQKAVGNTGPAALCGVASGVAAFSSHGPCLAAPRAGEANKCWVKKRSAKSYAKTNTSNGLCFSSLWNTGWRMRKGKQNKVSEGAFARQKDPEHQWMFAGWVVPLLTLRYVRFIVVLFSEDLTSYCFSIFIWDLKYCFSVWDFLPHLPIQMFLPQGRTSKIMKKDL